MHTQGAGEGKLEIQIIGPGGAKIPATTRKVDQYTHEVVYKPKQPGQYVINVTYGGQHITKSPFKVSSSTDTCIESGDVLRSFHGLQLI